MQHFCQFMNLFGQCLLPYFKSLKPFDQFAFPGVLMDQSQLLARLQHLHRGLLVVLYTHLEFNVFKFTFDRRL